jgi:hypothetical protein
MDKILMTPKSVIFRTYRVHFLIWECQYKARNKLKVEKNSVGNG